MRQRCRPGAEAVRRRDPAPALHATVTSRESAAGLEPRGLRGAADPARVRAREPAPATTGTRPGGRVPPRGEASPRSRRVQHPHPDRPARPPTGAPPTPPSVPAAAAPATTGRAAPARRVPPAGRVTAAAGVVAAVVAARGAGVASARPPARSAVGRGRGRGRTRAVRRPRTPAAAPLAERDPPPSAPSRARRDRHDEHQRHYQDDAHNHGVIPLPFPRSGPPWAPRSRAVRRGDRGMPGAPHGQSRVEQLLRVASGGQPPRAPGTRRTQVEEAPRRGAGWPA